MKHIFVITIFIGLLSASCGTSKNIDATRSLIANNINAAKENGIVLKSICRKSSSIDLKGKLYYVSFDSPATIPENTSFTICNGSLFFISGRGFSLSNGSSFLSKKVVFQTDKKVNLYLFSVESNTSRIKEISFDGCKFIGNVLSRVKFQPTSNSIGGIDNLSFVNCVGDTYDEDRCDVGAKFWIENGGYYKKCLIEGNRINNMVGPFVYLSDRSPLLTKETVEVQVKGNTFIGAPGVSINSYHCSVLIETMKCRFENNTVRGFVNANTGESATAYDSYLSCNELFYEGNTIEDICAISDGLGKRAYCEWGKSKSARAQNQYSCRVFKGNVFTNHPDVLASDYGVKKDADMRVSLFFYSTPFDLLDIEENRFEYTGGTIELPHQPLLIRSVKSIVIQDNYFTAMTCSGSLLCCSSDERKIESIRILDNKFNIKQGLLQLCRFSDNKGFGYGDIIIKGNSCSTGFAFSVFNADCFTFDDNTSIADDMVEHPVYYSLTDCKTYSIVLNKNYRSASTKPDIFLGMNGQGTIKYHVNNLKNLSYVQFRVPYDVNCYCLSLRYRDHDGLLVSSEISEYEMRTKGSKQQERRLSTVSRGDVLLRRNGVESNPLMLAMKGIDNRLTFDDKEKQSIIQISGHHSTWQALDFDTAYGVDLIFETR